MIQGVKVKTLTTHADERGFFREVLRMSDDFKVNDIGQISHSLVYTGVVKAWHAHKIQSQWNYVVTGLIRVALYDNRKESKTYKNLMEFLVGDNQSAQYYFFPKGVVHGYKVVVGPMNILYVTSGVYDLNDEIRIAHDDPSIGYNWISSSIT